MSLKFYPKDHHRFLPYLAELDNDPVLMIRRGSDACDFYAGPLVNLLAKARLLPKLKETPEEP